MPQPPPAARLLALGPVPEAANPPLADTERNDVINRERWTQCIIANHAAIGYFGVLEKTGYLPTPSRTP